MNRKVNEGDTDNVYQNEQKTFVAKEKDIQICQSSHGSAHSVRLLGKYIFYVMNT